MRVLCLGRCEYVFWNNCRVCTYSKLIAASKTEDFRDAAASEDRMTAGYRESICTSEAKTLLCMRERTASAEIELNFFLNTVESLLSQYKSSLKSLISSPWLSRIISYKQFEASCVFFYSNLNIPITVEKKEKLRTGSEEKLNHKKLGT